MFAVSRVRWIMIIDVCGGQRMVDNNIIVVPDPHTTGHTLVERVKNFSYDSADNALKKKYYVLQRCSFDILTQKISHPINWQLDSFPLVLFIFML